MTALTNDGAETRLHFGCGPLPRIIYTDRGGGGGGGGSLVTRRSTHPGGERLVTLLDFLGPNLGA